jgi:hypothetical protein
VFKIVRGKKHKKNHSLATNGIVSNWFVQFIENRIALFYVQFKHAYIF